MDWNHIKSGAYVTFWLTATASIIGPCYSLQKTLDKISDFAEISRETSQDYVDRQAGALFRSFVPSLRELEAKGQQEAIRRLRKNVEDVLNVNCNTNEFTVYEMPRLKSSGDGKLFFSMECSTQHDLSLYFSHSLLLPKEKPQKQ